MDFFDPIVRFFINSAHAAEPATAAAPPPAGGGFSFTLMLGLLFVFMYFVMWRPQSKRAKEQRNLLSSLAKGDEVVTAGGILGKITKVSDAYIVLELTENVEITVQKSSVVAALPKGTIKAI